MRFLFRLLCILLLAHFTATLMAWAPLNLWLDAGVGWLTLPAKQTLAAAQTLLPPPLASFLPSPRASTFLDALISGLTGVRGSPWAFMLPGRIAWASLLSIAFLMALDALLRATASAIGLMRAELRHRRQITQMAKGHERQVRHLEATKVAVAPPSPPTPIERAVASNLREEISRAQDRLNRDDSTRLYAREYFFHAFARDLQASSAARSPISAVLFRLGGIRGMAAGFSSPADAEQAIVSAAAPLRDLMTRQRGSVACRYEPSALSVILPGVGAQDGFNFARQMLAYWAQTRTQNGETPLEASAGVLTIDFARMGEKPAMLNEERLAQKLETLAYEATLKGAGEICAQAITTC